MDRWCAQCWRDGKMGFGGVDSFREVLNSTNYDIGGFLQFSYGFGMDLDRSLQGGSTRISASVSLE